MKFTSHLAIFISLAAAAPKDPAPIEVKLEMVGNSQVSATITNHSKRGLKILKPNSLLDRSGPKKSILMSSLGKPIRYMGIHQTISTRDLGDTAFQSIPAGKSVETTFNVAETFDISAGGAYTIRSSGVFQYATGNDNHIGGTIPFTSNTLNANINGSEAAIAMRSSRRTLKRTNVQKSSCDRQKLQKTKVALQNCASLSRAAHNAAYRNDALVQEYFKDSSNFTKTSIMNVFSKVAAECDQVSGTVSDTYCTDMYNGCDVGVLAYTVPDENMVVYCDLYYRSLPPFSQECHGQDQVTTTLHEMVHLSQIRGAHDFAYGYDQNGQLNNLEALLNADSYALFANAIHANCSSSS